MRIITLAELLDTIRSMHEVQVFYSVLQAMKSWAWDWERGYMCFSCIPTLNGGQSLVRVIRIMQTSS